MALTRPPMLYGPTDVQSWAARAETRRAAGRALELQLLDRGRDPLGGDRPVRHGALPVEVVGRVVALARFGRGPRGGVRQHRAGGDDRDEEEVVEAKAHGCGGCPGRRGSGSLNCRWAEEGRPEPMCAAAAWRERRRARGRPR